MIKLTSLLEDLRSESDNYYYHVTPAPYKELIQVHGLVVNGRKRTVSNYANHSSGKIFLCDVGVLDWWIYTIAAHAFDQFDDENYHDIAVFKILKSNLKEVEKDEVGSADSRGNSYYVTYDISPELLEFVKIVESPY